MTQWDGGLRDRLPTDEERRADRVAIEAAMPFVKAEAVDKLVLRLSGLSGDAFKLESLQYTCAILAAMEAEGEVGSVETAVVLATVKAAALKLRLGLNCAWRIKADTIA